MGFALLLSFSPILAIIGYLIFSLSPFIMDKPYPLFAVGTVIFSGSSGLLELLLSPIVDSIPTSDEKSKAMSILHSFYSWGQILVVAGTTGLLALCHQENWQYIAIGWLIFPIVDLTMFIYVPLAPMLPEKKRTSFLHLKEKGVFIIFVILIFLSGASELVLSQWCSAFVERALGIKKSIGDLAGMCVFAFLMGIGRAFHGIWGEKVSLRLLILVEFGFTSVCYIVVSFSTNNIVSLIFCGLTGLGVSNLWPGIISLTAERFDKSGAWIFAILAAGGDIGGAFGPWIIGMIIDASQKNQALMNWGAKRGFGEEQTGLRFGITIGTIFPLSAFLILLIFLIKTNKGIYGKRHLIIGGAGTSSDVSTSYFDNPQQTDSELSSI